jgi:hypothetical protein
MATWTEKLCAGARHRITCEEIALWRRVLKHVVTRTFRVGQQVHVRVGHHVVVVVPVGHLETIILNLIIFLNFIIRILFIFLFFNICF